MQDDDFDNVSPLDHRYRDERMQAYLSENAFIRYKLRVELALVKALAGSGVCGPAVVAEVDAACAGVTAVDVYDEERRIGHDVRALVNRIRAGVSEESRRFIHLAATSYDIVDTANAARYRDVVNAVVLPELRELARVLIDIAVREAGTAQIGRTHGQHAVPVTFGFAMAGYVSRLGGCIEAIAAAAAKLVGKFSGAVGAYNASSLLVDDPAAFEREVLAELGLAPADQATQIVQPEPLTRLMAELVIAAGVIADLADDMRHLQRTEIAEVGEAFAAEQVGSSTMPQKRNPITFENAKSCWKVIVARMTTVFMDQLCEHQRDLTNSASARTYGEMLCYLVQMAKRMRRTMAALVVDRDSLERNLAHESGLAAEPLYILLAAAGHPDAHEKVRRLAIAARGRREPLGRAALNEPELAPYLAKMTPAQQAIIAEPTRYTGLAAERAVAIAGEWKRRLGL